MPGVADSGKDPIMATVAINLPIWRSKYRAQEREALLRRSALLDQREDKGNGLEGDAALALYHYQDAARKIGLYGDTLLPKAEQSLAVAQQAFEAGKTDFMTLIDAQRVLLEFRLAVAKARADQGKRFAELQMLTGAGLLQTEPSPSE
jgi:outer membrane protein TolC